MKRLILIKQSRSIDLAHLYEHVFCRHVDELFSNNDLFPYLDYSLVGKTYYGGIIYIDLELYSNAAILLAANISSLDIKTDEAIISVAVDQLMAEKDSIFHSQGYEKVKEALRELHDVSWQDIDTVNLIDVKIFRRVKQPFYLSHVTNKKASNFTLGIILDSDFASSYSELLPLFRQVAWFITVVLQEKLSSSCGYYSFTDEFIRNKRITGQYNTFKVAYITEVNINQNLEVCKKAIHKLFEHNAFSRFMSDLRNVSYYTDSYIAPNLEKNYEDTLMVIGSLGWQSIATDKNCDSILKHMTISLKCNKEIASLDVASCKLLI